jgi:putative phage-type endonuclease
MLQRSDEWYQARLGKVTASRIGDVMARTKSGYGAGRKTYMVELVVERITGMQAESYESRAMRRGTEEEPMSITEYEVREVVMVEPVGFVQHPTIEMSGASPDGLVNEDGLVEMKNPNTATHFDTILTRKISRRYLLQIQWQLACTGRLWCDFVSCDTRLSNPYRLVVIRVERDDELIEMISDEVVKFLGELSAMVDAVEAVGDG